MRPWWADVHLHRAALLLALACVVAMVILALR